MTLEEYRRMYGWSVSALAREAGLDNNTARKALAGKAKITPTTAQSIARAISRAAGRTILVTDIEGLNVNW